MRTLHGKRTPIAKAKKAKLAGRVGQPNGPTQTQTTSRVPGGVSATRKGSGRLPRVRLTALNV